MTEPAAATGPFTPVRCAVTVPLSPERAFALFTEGYYSWWPHGHHLGKARPRSRRHVVAGQRHADPRCRRGGKRCVITMGRGDSQYAHQPVPG